MLHVVYAAAFSSRVWGKTVLCKQMMILVQKQNFNEDGHVNNRESNEPFRFGLFIFTRSDPRNKKRVNLFLEMKKRNESSLEK